uniref:Uncharacterized protein n=1 Tax=Moschus moschiferus TaxID=68415 RepID=A0A8C6CJV9_MOSMO
MPPFPRVKLRRQKDQVRFTIPWHLAQDAVHLVGSSWQPQNVDGAVAALQGEGPSMMGTMCALWEKAEDREWLVAMDPAVLTLPHVEDEEGREAGGVGATLPCSPPCQGDTRGRSPKRNTLRRQTALLGLTKSLAMELASQGIWVHGVSPGLIKITSQRSPGLMGRCHHSQPHLVFSCRVGWPEDCAEPVSFLCSPEAGSITSKNIMVAGFSPTSEGHELRAQACLLM